MNKSARLDDSYRNAKQTERVLLSRNSFKSAVKSFRAKWNIPEKGLTKSKIESWQIWFIQQRKTYRPSDRDIVLEKERHKRIDRNSTQLLKGFDRLIDKYLDTSSLDAERVFRNDIGEILRQQKLNPRWYIYVERYLLLNERIRVPSGMEFRTEVDEISGQEVIMLKITEEIRKADLLAVLRTIKQYQKKLPYHQKIKTQPMRVFERNKIVFEKHEAKQPMEGIKDFLDEHYPKKTKGDIHTDEDVLKMIGQYKKALSEIS